MFKMNLEKAEDQDIKLATSIGSLKKQDSCRKNIYFCFTDYTKVFDCVDHNKLWKILQEMGLPAHLTCLLRNLCVGQEWTWNNRLVPDRERSTSRLYIFTLLIYPICRVHHEKNAELEEAQAGSKIAGRNINNLRYADDTTLMAENKEEVKNLLMKVKESEKLA